MIMSQDNTVWLWDFMHMSSGRQALWTEQGAYTYEDLLTEINQWQLKLDAAGLSASLNPRVAIIGEFCLGSIALFLALIRSKAIVVPLADDDSGVIESRLKLIGIQAIVDFRQGSEIRLVANQARVEHPLIDECNGYGTAGIVMFTSGSTGQSKAVLYRADYLVGKFKDARRKPHRTLLFLKFDHIGGINTLFSVLSSGGAVVTSRSRQPEKICQLIESARVTLLPTTPSFLTMLVMSRFYERYDLSSLEVITYGTEVMPQSTLIAVARLFPEVKLKQTYGLTEMGIMQTYSKSNDSKWVKLGGDGMEWKVVAGVLWIKTKTPMLGYLNSPMPLDSEGWYNTQDQVEVDGDYLMFLGRKSEIINVGGEKVYPQEIEDVILEMPNVAEVLVRGANNPVTGQTVCADVVLQNSEDSNEFRRRLRNFCQGRLARYKIPTQVRISEQLFTGSRLKKQRVA